jgi:hypothetical protein
MKEAWNTFHAHEYRLEERFERCKNTCIERYRRRLIGLATGPQVIRSLDRSPFPECNCKPNCVKTMPVIFTYLYGFMCLNVAWEQKAQFLASAITREMNRKGDLVFAYHVKTCDSILIPVCHKFFKAIGHISNRTLKRFALLLFCKFIHKLK